MNVVSRIGLNTGRTIPILGFGTWELYGDTAYKSVRCALESGIRHIDTASMYDNEKEIGRAVRDSGIPRKDIFITSKVWNDQQGYDSTLKAYKESLKKLEMDYLDMYMVHWPVKETRINTYQAIETLYKKNKIKNIGVCNYLIEHLKEIFEASDIKPAVNQIELHPFDYEFRKPVIDFCRKHKIQMEAYRPLVKAKYNDNKVLQSMSRRYGASVPQLLIRWGLKKGFVVIPRSSKPEHIRQNIDVFNLDINSDDMIILDGLNENLSSTSKFGPEDFL